MMKWCIAFLLISCSLAMADTCPAGYTALGAVRCLYYSQTGSDANAGTKASPWTNTPYMRGNAVAGYVHAAGDWFIGKGGETWPVAQMPNCHTGSGTQANPDGYGVDTSWFVNWSATSVTITGSSVHLNVDATGHASGHFFMNGSSWVGKTISFNAGAETATISSVTDGSNLVLSSPPGDLTNASATVAAFSLPEWDQSYTNLSGLAQSPCNTRSAMFEPHGDWIFLDSMELAHNAYLANNFDGLIAVNQSNLYSAGHIKVTNSVLHGWMIFDQATNADRCGTNDGAFVAAGISGAVVLAGYPWLESNEITNVEMDGVTFSVGGFTVNGANGECVGGSAGTVLSNNIHNCPSGLNVGAYGNVAYNTLNNMAWPYKQYDLTNNCTTKTPTPGTAAHTNVIYPRGPGVFHHNLIENTATAIVGQSTIGASEIFFAHVCEGNTANTTAGQTNTVTFYDNVISLGTSSGGVPIQPTTDASTSPGGACPAGVFNVFNIYENTIWVATNSMMKGKNATGLPLAVNWQNNQMITNKAANSIYCYTGQPCTGDATTLTFPGGTDKSILKTNAQMGTTGLNTTPLSTFEPASVAAYTVDVGYNMALVDPTQYANDYLLVTRPQNSIYDVGAFEFFTAASSYLVNVAAGGTWTGTIVGSGGSPASTVNCTVTAGVASGTCSETQNAGATPTYTPTVTVGSLIGWSGGGCSGTGTCVPTVNSPVTVTMTGNVTISCSLTFASNSLNAPSQASATTTMSGLSGPNSFWFIFGPPPDNLPIYECGYPFSGCNANGQTGNIIPVGSGLYTGGACSNGVCCTGSTAPLNINTGAGSAAH